MLDRKHEWNPLGVLFSSLEIRCAAGRFGAAEYIEFSGAMRVPSLVTA
jgi:hypothetical protein